MDETGLPVSGSSQEGPVPERRDPVPPPATKLKTHAGFLVLGLLAPFALSILTGIVGGLLANIGNGALSPILAFTGLSGPALFVGVLIAYLVGKQKGNSKLMSFGKGGVIAYVTMFLLALLAFGSCLVMGLPV